MNVEKKTFIFVDFVKKKQILYGKKDHIKNALAKNKNTIKKYKKDPKHYKKDPGHFKRTPKMTIMPLLSFCNVWSNFCIF